MEKRASGENCVLAIGGFMCQSGECAERFSPLQILLWWPGALSKDIQLKRLDLDTNNHCSFSILDWKVHINNG